MFDSFAFALALWIGSLPAAAAPAKPAPHHNTSLAAAPAAAPAPITSVGSLGDLSFGMPLFGQTAAAVTASKPTANEVVSKIQSFYAATQQLTAKFRQTVTNATFGKKTISDGNVYIKKPGKMRWDYFEKKKGSAKPAVRKSFLSDGVTLWMADHPNKQVFKKNLEQNMLPVAVTFLYGKGDLARDFDAVLDASGTYGTKSDLVLSLTPKKPSAQYKKLFLVVDPTNFRVRQSIIIDSSDNVNDFRFYEPDLAKAIDDKVFGFDEKAARARGYDIKDGDAPADTGG